MVDACRIAIISLSARSSSGGAKSLQLLAKSSATPESVSLELHLSERVDATARGPRFNLKQSDGPGGKQMKILKSYYFGAVVLAFSTSLSLAQTGSITRIEENNPAIAYGGTWVPDTLGVHSGGRAVVSDQSGARAFLAFTGTGISWIGDAAFNRGVARVYLDGNPSIVDTYSDPRHGQQALFIGKGLAPGVHALSIEVTQMKNVNAEGSGISIDAFDIENGTIVTANLTGNVVANPGYIEQNSPAVSYSGSWYVNNSPRASAGSAVLAMDPGSKAGVTFNGTGIIWIGYMDPWSGWAKVYVDGVLKTTLDTYYLPWGDGASDEIWRRPIWGVTDLPNGTHTLLIEVLGEYASKSGGAWIWIDAFRVLGSGAQ